MGKQIITRRPTNQDGKDRRQAVSLDSAAPNRTKPPPDENSNKDLEQWLEDCESCPLRQEAELASQLTSAVKASDQRLGHIEQSLADLGEHFGVIRSELQRFETDEQVLSDLRDRHSALYERHHEREVLRPLFLALIGILDRCGETTAGLQKWLARHSGKRSTPAYKATQRLLDARCADQTEIESLLVSFAVESFQHERDEFDPATQKAVCRVETEVDELNGTIAERLRPGYRRNDLILRQEYVSVYIHRNHKPGEKKGVQE